MLGLAGAFWGVSCSGSASNAGPYRAIEFSVDSSRLGPALTPGPVSVSVPVGWIPADSVTLEQIRSAAALDTSRFRFDLLSVNLDQVGGSAMFVKAFTTKSEFLPWARDLVAQLRSTRPGQDIREEWLLFNGVPGVQIYSADSLRIQFAILLDTRPVIGVDYVVPREIWNQQVHSVESSLGTIRKP
jgi:hypothetical protein